MRCLGRTIVSALLLGLLWWRVGALWQDAIPAGSQPSNIHMARLEAASARLTYTLDETAWTLFAIPAGATSLRVATNANLPGALEAEPEARWRYAVSYELLDAQDRAQAQRVYHHRSRITRHAAPDAQDASPIAFYLDASLIPTDTRTFVVDLSGFPTARRARFRLHMKDDAVKGVAMSLYTRAPMSERQADYLWRRLSGEQKKNLAQGLAYSMAFLQPSEQLQLLKNRWQALGPKGIEGKDYHARKLYALNDIEPEGASAPALPSGLVIDARHDGVMEIPAGGLPLRLAFTPLPGSRSAPDRHGIRLTWYGKYPQEQSRHHAPWRDGGAQFEGVFAPGLLVLRVLEGAAVAQAFRRDAAGETPWVAEPRHSRMYLVEPDGSIDFIIAHAGDAATPFRIDIRHLPSPGHPANTHPLAVRYEMLNAAGEVTQAG